jgi:hypothetical protein
MALYDTADLLRRCKNLSRRPATDQAMTDTKWYDFLTEAQQEAYPDIFSRFPDYGYSTPVLLTSTDGGKTYTFGLDQGVSGDPIRPTGHTEIYPNLSAIPDSPLTPGADFLIEGGLIRMPGNRTRLFPNGPYARFVADPAVAISAAQEPLLQPKMARMLLVYKALEQWASRRGSGANPSYWEGKYDKYLEKVFLSLATAYNRRGSQAAGADSDRVWWYSGDLGQSGLNT